ncbi:MAG: hypothetical protein RMA76_19015 [Deltaproteobacteria bacterium]
MCAFECTADADCTDGELCDDFGRCALEGTNVFPLANLDGKGRATLQQAQVRRSPSGIYTLSIRADGGPVARARVAPGANVEVALAPPGVDLDELDFGSELMLEGLAADSVTDIAVKESPSMMGEPSASARVQVLDDAGGRSEATVAPDLVTAPVGPVAGVYAGQMQLVQVGANAFSLAPPVARITVPIRAEVYEPNGNEARIRIIDDSRLMNPAGAWTGTLELAPDDDDVFGSVVMPAFEWAAPSPVAGSGRLHVVAVAEPAGLRTDPLAETWSGDLRFSLAVTLTGVSANIAREPIAVFEIALERTDDLPEGAPPAVDSDAQLAYVPAQEATTRFLAEQNYVDLVADLEQTQLTLEDQRSVWRRAQSDAPSLPQSAFSGPLTTDSRAWLQTVLGGFIADARPPTMLADQGAADDAPNIGMLTRFDGWETIPPTGAVDEFTAKAYFGDWMGGDFAGWLDGFVLARFGHFTGFRDIGMRDRIQSIAMAFFVDSTLEVSDYEQPQPDVSLVSLASTAHAPFPTTWTIGGRTTRPVVPCAFENAATDVVFSVRTDGRTHNNRPRFDPARSSGGANFCEALARRYQCEPIDLTTAGTVQARQFNIGLAVLISGEDNQIRLESVIVPVTATAGCEVRPVSKNAVTSILCDHRSANGAAFEPDRFTSALDPATGDLQCENGAGLAVGLDQPRAADELLTACRSDLEALAQPPSPGTTGDLSARLGRGGFDESTCLSAPRFLTRFGAVSESIRAAALVGTPDGAPEDPRPDVLTARLAQRFVQAATFVASEAVQRVEVLPGVDSTDERSALVDAIARTNQALRLLLHPRVFTPLASLDDAVLAEKNIYDAVTAVDDPAPALWSTDESLLTSVTELLEVHSQLVARLVEHDVRLGATTLPTEVSEALRLQVPLNGLVNELLAGVTLRRTPEWKAALDRAVTRAADAQAEAVQLIQAVNAGRNPLGIEDEDLPLYFEQVATDAGSRFTAVSDYLIGSDFSTFSPVPSLVQDAVDAFATARTAYLAEQQRMVQVENVQADRDLFVRMERVALGAEVLDLCGDDVFGGLGAEALAIALEDGDLDIDGCWYQSDLPVCTPQPDPVSDAERELESVRSTIYQELCMASGRVGVTATSIEFEYVAGREPSEEEKADDQYVGRYMRGFDHNLIDYASPLLSEIHAKASRDFGVGGDSFGSILDANLTTVRRRARLGPYYGDIRLDEFRFDVRGSDVFVRESSAIGEIDLGPRVATIPVTPGYVRAPFFGTLKPAALNPCLNPDVPEDFPAVMPQVVFTGDDPTTARLRCAPRQAGAGDAFEVEYDPDLVAPFTTLAADPTLSQRTAFLEQQQRCQLLFPLPGQPDALSTAQPPSVCYSGALGEVAFGLRILATDIATARAEFNALLDEYDIQVRSCDILRAGNREIEGLEEDHANTMSDLNAAKTAVDSAAVASHAVADCADAVGSDTKFGAASGTACTAGGVAAGFEIASLAIQAAMDDAQRSHDLTVLGIENDIEEERCFKEAELALVGLDAAQLRIRRAMQEASAGYLEFEGLREQLVRRVPRGLADVAAAEASLASVVGRDPWLNDDIEAFRRKFALARRASYLGVRAVEYEFQQSLSARADVLAAQEANDLVEVLDELRAIKATGSVNGAVPAELTQVISLKNEILQVADQLEVDPGNHILDATERFRAILTHPRFEVRRDGRRLGVRIPFNLAPLSALNRGDASGIPFALENACAERVWSLNATVVGDEARMFQGLAQTVNLEIQQANTFYANRCARAADDSFQVASTRPRRNLFRLPGVGEGVPNLVDDSARNFATARLQARLNVDPTTLASSTTVDGESTELAARLLFGEYALFIPESELPNVDDEGRPVGDGLRLNEVDDILLRIDYLSVSR